MQGKFEMLNPLQLALLVFISASQPVAVGRELPSILHREMLWYHFVMEQRISEEFLLKIRKAAKELGMFIICQLQLPTIAHL